MAEIQWSDAQKLAIDTSGRNLLVSAAAGSGKTAVLIERILRKLKRSDHPADITNLLVVTFTKAAAAEMREKMRQSILKELEKGELDGRTAQHLKKQLTLLTQADVCTIDSFCNKLLRNYFHLTDIDPAYRIADESELGILEDDVVKAVLKAEYENPSEAFMTLFDAFESVKASRETKRDIAATVQAIYRYSQNAADPEAWLQECLACYEIRDEDAFDNAAWNRAYIDREKDHLRIAKEKADELAALAAASDGPAFYGGIAETFRQALADALTKSTYGELHRWCMASGSVMETRKPSAPRKGEYDEEKKERASQLIDEIKKLYKANVPARFSRPVEEILQEFVDTLPLATELIRLVRAYAKLLTEVKREKRILSFNDIEHAVLDLLTRSEEGQVIASELAANYEEILIDEYQDSTELQEVILNALAKKADGQSVNVFMVGDMKQSIYRFRMADPALFVDKYYSYPHVLDGPALTGKVELAENFRSRQCVTDSVNYFFRKLMHRSVGDVEYDRAAELIPKGTFVETPYPVGGKTAFMVSDPSDVADADDPGNENMEDLSTDEQEAAMIAEEILRITDPETGLYVQDKVNGEPAVRKAQYKDIVILMRGTKGKEKTYASMLTSYGIPCYVEQKRGYYDTFEVQFLINLLSVIDNPKDDVQLAAVSHSPFYGLTNEEFARIKVETGVRRGLYDAFRKYVKSHGGDGKNETSDRLNKLFESLDRFRMLSQQMSLSVLIATIIREIGMEAFVGAMPGGEQRLANIRELVSKAAAFEQTLYRGIFNFLRYIERKKELSEEEGEVSVAGENENLVRILTAHASKGLEYPIVFVASLGKSFNQMWTRENVYLDQKLGLGINRFSDRPRSQRVTYFKNVLRSNGINDAIGEELRILYVAMTRAKERLYLTGSVRKGKEPFQMPAAACSAPCSVDIRNAKSFLELLLLCFDPAEPSVEWRAPFTKDAFEFSRKKHMVRKALEEEELRAALKTSVREDTAKKVGEILGGNYLYDDLYKVRSTMSVSLLKKIESEDRLDPVEFDKALVDDRTAQSMEPETRTDREKKRRYGLSLNPLITGAERGTLYHKVLELLDPFKTAAENLEALRNRHLLSEVENDTIQPELIDAFLNSGLGERFRAALKNGRGYRETPFIIGLPLKDIRADRNYEVKDPGELVMIQGVIDLYFEEADGLVLVDYKTDRVAKGGELKERYASQLGYYEKALRMMTGKPVKEKWIYSIPLQECVAL